MNWKNGLLSEITEDYPRLGGIPWQLVEGDMANNIGGGPIEFYPPTENDNPVFGKPTMSVFDTGMPREDLRRMIFGDMLHYLPMVDEDWSSMRDEYAGSLTSQQQKINRNAYQRDVRNSIEQGLRPRSYDKFMDINRLDAHVRGYLAPDRRNDWAGSYNPEQISILKRMGGLLGQEKIEGDEKY